MIGGVGGAPMPVPLLKVWEERGVRAAAGLRHDRDQPGGADARRGGRRAQGRLVRQAGAAYRSADRPSRRQPDAGVGELGEFWVKGPNITPGYWNRPDANASSFTDGWLHTGDAARDRRRRLLLHRRPLEGHVHLRRRERLSGRGRERAVSARRDRRGRRDRHARRAMGRDRHGDRRGEARPQRSTEAEIHAHCASQPGALQVPAR